jgi:hypothetical protein
MADLLNTQSVRAQALAESRAVDFQPLLPRSSETRLEKSTEAFTPRRALREAES